MNTPLRTKGQKDKETIRFVHLHLILLSPNVAKYIAVLTLILAFLLALTPTASAQGIDTNPPPPGRIPPIGGPISIDLVSVDAVLDGPIATVHVTQVFRNQADWQVEGTYIFPLPANAAIGDFQMTVDGQVLEGEVLTKEEARGIYEAIVRRRQDPALLEYLGQGLFQTSVFPIPPGDSRKIELTYTQTLLLESGLYHFRYPLRTRQYSAAPVGNIALRVELRNQPGLRTLYSPSHDVGIDRSGDDAALIGYEAANTAPEQDFELLFGVSQEAIGLNLISYKPAGEDGFFLLLAAPGIEVAPDQVVQRDLILVMDTSGSMEGEKMAQAKQAAHFLVDHLNPGDRFNLVAFSTGVRLWEPKLQTGNSQRVKSAHRWIDSLDASGSTDINRALLEALAQLADGGSARPAYLLFMTDGLPTLGETESPRIIANALANLPDRSLRLFSFGVGFDVDTNLLDELSAELGGRSRYVKPDQRIDETVGDFYAQISTPVLAGVSIDMPGIRVDETYPFPLPDLFAGEQLVLAGRYRSGGDTTVTLSGTVNGQKRSFSYPDQRLLPAGGEPSIARLWATRKIGVLLAQIRRNGPDQELIDTVVALSSEYGIVTPYTSYLVVEPEFDMAAARRMDLNAAPIPIEAPAAREVVVTVQVEKMVESGASGESAVAASEAREGLRGADRAQEQTGVRYVAGKSFTRQSAFTDAEGNLHELWVDNAYRDDMTVQAVVFGSDEYFDLAADAAQWLAISSELMVVLDGTAYRISASETPAEPVVEPPVSLTPTPAASLLQSPAPNPWDAFAAWLRALFGR